MRDKPTKRPLAAVLALLACLSATSLLSGSALGVSILLPPQVELNGRTSPSRLPAATHEPIALTLEGRIWDPGVEEERPPPLATLSLQFDRAGAVFTKGLPVCRPPSSPDFGWSGCKDALVGHGEVEILVGVPEHPTFRAIGQLEIFNGAPRGRDPVFLYKVEAHMPAPTTFIASGVIEKSHGKFGTQTSIRIPTIAAGHGSLVGFRAEIGKAWTYKARRVNLLTARCPDGSLLAHGKFGFSDGSRITGTVDKTCVRRKREATSRRKTNRLNEE